MFLFFDGGLDLPLSMRVVSYFGTFVVLIISRVSSCCHLIEVRVFLGVNGLPAYPAWKDCFAPQSGLEIAVHWVSRCFTGNIRHRRRIFSRRHITGTFQAMVRFLWFAPFAARSRPLASPPIYRPAASSAFFIAHRFPHFLSVRMR